MAKSINITKKSPFNVNLESKLITKTFGREEDILEVQIIDFDNNILDINPNFTDYSIPEESLEEGEEREDSSPLNVTTKEPKIVNPKAKGAGDRDYERLGPNNSKDGYWFNTGYEMIWVSTATMGTSNTKEFTDTIGMDPTKYLNDRGYNYGEYRLVLIFKRHKIFNPTLNDPHPFIVKEISPSRTELKIVSPKNSNLLFAEATNIFINELESSAYFKEFILSFENNLEAVGMNLALNKNTKLYELMIKTLTPVSSRIVEQSPFYIFENITDPIIITVDLGEMEIKDKFKYLQGPNFNIDTRLNNSIPSEFKNYNQILEYTLTSSYQNLLNKLENKEIPNITYDYIRPVSESLETVEETYHFENFVHFGSAVERLKNFKYKLGLIEFYNKQIGKIESITSTIPNVALNNKENLNTKKQELIKGFDGYEQFLYYTTGSNIYTWPKSNTSGSLYPTTSSVTSTWLGDERDQFNNYGGQLLSASLYDKQNEYALINLIPLHITDNPDNDFYKSFTHMIGQHFDQIWTYIKHITEINNAHNKRGVSKDLVYFTLKSLGLETFDQFENTNLIEYILGEGTSGSAYYDTPTSQSLVTASLEGSIPKEDITKEVWKRLYHNAPYLLKTKGTERGIKALMSCYGLPSTVLNIKEYGGPTKNFDLDTTYKTFSYDKSSLALQGSTVASAGKHGYFIKSPWSSSLTTDLSSSAKTIELRIKPERDKDVNIDYNIISLEEETDNHSLFLNLKMWTGGDISSSGDSKQYGRLQLHSGSSTTPISSSAYFPIFNGDFWNVFMGTEGTQGSASDVVFGAYQSNWLKNISYYTQSYSQPEELRAKTFGDPYYGGNHIECAINAYFGGDHTETTNLGYSGSIQEIRYHFGELLSHFTLKKHALEPFMYAGNTTSSAYDNVVLRLPLGSNNIEDSSSFHPNISVNYIDSSSIMTSMSIQQWEESTETHHHITPDTVGISMTSEKVRIDTGTIDDDILSINVKSEVSTLDRQPQDYEDLGIFLSPTTEINEDIVYTLGAFRLDDLIGSPLPSAQTASLYTDLKHLRKQYFKKVKRRFNYWDYIKTIQYIDHTLFKLIEQWVPFKANTKTGLLIEPHYLERTKFARELPVIDDGQTMISGSYNTIHADVKGESIDEFYSLKSSSMGGGNVVTTNNFNNSILRATGSNGLRLEQGTNFTINVSGHILDERQEAAQAPIIPNSTGSKAIKRRSSTLLGNATEGRLSSKYYKFGEYYK